MQLEKRQEQPARASYIVIHSTAEYELALSAWVVEVDGRKEKKKKLAAFSTCSNSHCICIQRKGLTKYSCLSLSLFFLSSFVVLTCYIICVCITMYIYGDIFIHIYIYQPSPCTYIRSLLFLPPYHCQKENRNVFGISHIRKSSLASSSSLCSSYLAS